jgi:hypothetical protein
MSMECLPADGGFARRWRVDLCVNRVLSDESDLSVLSDLVVNSNRY